MSDLLNKIEFAAEHLPKDFSIIIQVEKDAGWVEAWSGSNLISPEWVGAADDSLEDQFQALLNYAMENTPK